MPNLKTLALISLSAIGLASISVAQRGVENHGKHGIWYWNSKNAAVDDDESSVPQLEHPGDAPKFYTRPPMRFSLLNLSVFSRFTSVQVNVDALGHNIPGDAANEPSLVVDPTNPNRIAVGWRQFDSVTSNFRQAGNAYSTNGGTTWHRNLPITPGLFRSDPVLATDATGKFYYNSLQETFFTDDFLSSNWGSFWNFIAPATGGDKQWMTVDATNSVGRGNQYETWSTAGNNWGGRQFSRSVDGGATWLDPINIPGSPVWGTLDVSTAGDLYLGGLGDTSFIFCRSKNAKIKTQTPVFDLSTPVDLGGAIVFASAMNPEGLLGQMWMVADKSPTPRVGNIYMLCSVGVNDQNPCDVHFSRSSDGGQTWSKWTRINDDPVNRGASHWFGTLSIAPNGRLDACWLDNRASPTLNNSALFFSSSFDGGKTWSKSTQVSQSFNPNIGYPNQNKIGDYLGMISSNTSARIAYSATFNGEEDIWFLQVPPAAGSALDAVSVQPYLGTYESGTADSVRREDTASFVMGSAVSTTGLGNVAGVIANYTLPTLTASSLTVKFHASTSAATTGMVWLYNWTTKNYDFLSSSVPLGPAPVEATVPCNSSATPYVNSLGQVRVLLRAHRPITQTGGTPFTLNVDLLQLLFG